MYFFREFKGKLTVLKWSSQTFLFSLVLLISITTWLIVAFSPVYRFWGVVAALFLIVPRIVFFAYVRGSAIRVSENQFSEIYKRVKELSIKIGIITPPDVYIMHRGGKIASVTAALFSLRIIILTPELLEACGKSKAVKDFIIGRELGHIKEGHFTGRWLLTPGLIFPLIGTAYLRACNYTADRYGAALSGNKDAAIKGLTILSVGAKYAAKININEYTEQYKNLNTGFLTLGKWLSKTPQLTERIIAIDPDLYRKKVSLVNGNVLGATIVTLFSIFFIIVYAIANTGENTIKEDSDARPTPADSGYVMKMTIEEAKLKVNEDLEKLAVIVENYKIKTGSYPKDGSKNLSSVWSSLYPSSEEPIDPFDGTPYGYELIDNGYVIYSCGPDGEFDSFDDIVYNSKEKMKALI